MTPSHALACAHNVLLECHRVRFVYQELFSLKCKAPGDERRESPKCSASLSRGCVKGGVTLPYEEVGRHSCEYVAHDPLGRKTAVHDGLGARDNRELDQVRQDEERP